MVRRGADVSLDRQQDPDSRPRPSGIAARGPEDLPDPPTKGRTMLNATGRARELRDAGVSLSFIAKPLTAEGSPTPKGGAWHGSSVFRTLQPPKSGPGRGFRKPHTEESKRK